MIRLVLGLFASIYTALGSYFQFFEVSVTTYVCLASSFFFFSLIIFLSLLHTVESPSRRYITLFMDITYTSLTIYVTDGQSQVLWLLYVWLYIGYGSRYGKRYLFAAQIMALLQYCLVIYSTALWQHYPLELATHLIILLTLPFYLLSMIQRLHQAREEALKVSQLKSQFLASMSHEIRTPLNGIVGTAHLLLKTRLDQKQQQLALALKSSSEILLTLVNDILDFSTIEAGKIQWQPEVVNLAENIKKIFQTLAYEARQKQLQLSYEIANDVPQWIQVDRKYLNQILINLLGNAIKFTPKGKVSLEIHLAKRAKPEKQATDGHKCWLEFTIIDTGIGMTADETTHIFERFVRSESAKATPGSGLGASICKELIEKMGGRISLHSTPGRGSRFDFVIPVEIVPQSPDKKQPDRTDTAATGLRILVVEDDDINAMVLEEFLQGMGHVCERAKDGRQCLQKLEGQNYQLIFMDMHMPGMSGLEATRKIRVSNSQVIIIGLTASATTQHQHQCLAAGMNDFLPKPLTPEKLVAIIEKYY